MPFVTPDDVITLLERWMFPCTADTDCTHARCRDTRIVLRDLAVLADDQERLTSIIRNTFGWTDGT